MALGKSICIYLTDATVTGMRYVEQVNWTGHGLACPRNKLSELSSLCEIGFACPNLILKMSIKRTSHEKGIPINLSKTRLPKLLKGPQIIKMREKYV